MIKNVLLFLVILALPMVAYAQPAGSPAHLQFRAVLHDPAKPTAELFFSDKSGTVVPLELYKRDLARPQLTSLVNGTLLLYDKIVEDPKNLEASIAATCKIPTGTKRAIIIILPSPANTKPAYRMVCIDDSAKEFPKGEAKVLTLISCEAAVEVGEHKLPIHPGQLTNIPPVKKVNRYNMAQTKIYRMTDGAWTISEDYPLQYLESIRRIFILHTNPGATQPSVRIIEDTVSPTAPLLTR
jgi:hypothetical protein